MEAHYDDEDSKHPNKSSKNRNMVTVDIQDGNYRVRTNGKLQSIDVVQEAHGSWNVYVYMSHC